MTGTLDRIGAFIAKGVKWAFPTRGYLEGYTGRRPWENGMFSTRLGEYLTAVDDLVEKFGPREDYALPRYWCISDSAEGRAKSAMGRSLKSYDKWRNKVSPFSRPMYDGHDLRRVLDHYADLLGAYGPDPDYELPQPPGNIHITSRGGMSRHDIFMQMTLQKVGRTLADYDVYRAEDVARKEGLWVKDRGPTSGIFPSWSRHGQDEDGTLIIERRDTEPREDVFDVDAYRTYQRDAWQRDKQAAPVGP